MLLSHTSQYLLRLETNQQNIMISSSYYENFFIKERISNCVSYNHHGCIDTDLLATPVLINITLLPDFPPEMTLNHDETKCSCYPILANNGFSCLVKNKTGLLQWNGTVSVWVNATFNKDHVQQILPPALLQIRQKDSQHWR